MNDPERVNQLEARVIRGDRAALADLFALYRPRLWRIVQLRLPPRLQGRIDADDVLQDAWLRMEARIGSFLTEASLSSFVWFRMIVAQALIDLERRHLVAGKRSAVREAFHPRGWSPESSSSALVFHVSARTPSPSSAAMHAEQAVLVDDALQSLSDLDREILFLRHFEELTNSETAAVLQVSEQAASARYVRALSRMKRAVATIAQPSGKQPDA